MKIIALVFSCMISCSALAQDLSDFERGYEEGKKSCAAPNVAWICSVYDGGQVVGHGTSKAEAILDIPKDRLERGIRFGSQLNCSALTM